MMKQIQEAEARAQKATTSTNSIEIQLGEVTANLREETKEKASMTSKLEEMNREMKNKVQEAEIGAREATTSSNRLEIKLAEITANLKGEKKEKAATNSKLEDMNRPMKKQIEEAEARAQVATASNNRLEIQLAEVTANLREETREKAAMKINS